MKLTSAILGIIVAVLAVLFVIKSRPAGDGIPTVSPSTSVAVQSVGPSGFFQADQVRPSDVVIRYTADGFAPTDVTVKKGTRIVWINESSKPIWPASDLHPTHEIYPEFDPQEPYNSGQAWGFVFTKTGTWNFHDHLRASQRGTVTVTE